MVSDALNEDVDQVIAITNDSDFAPAMEMIRKQTNATLGLIVPTKKNSAAAKAELEKHAHWTRSYFSEDEFAHSQLPSMVRTNLKVLHKPISMCNDPVTVAELRAYMDRYANDFGGRSS